MNIYILCVWQTYFFCIYANNFINCTHTCIMCMKCSADSILILHLYVIFVPSHLWSLSIPCLAVILFFFVCFVFFFFLQMDMKFLLQFINISYLAALLVLLYLWPLMDSLFGRHISFSLFLPISFGFVHTCVYLQNTNALELLRWQPQIVYICMPHFFFHICDTLHIPCLTGIFHFCRCLTFLIANHRNFTIGSHISS